MTEPEPGSGTSVTRTSKGLPGRRRARPLAGPSRPGPGVHYSAEPSAEVEDRVRERPFKLASTVTRQRPGSLAVSLLGLVVYLYS